VLDLAPERRAYCLDEKRRLGRYRSTPRATKFDVESRKKGAECASGGTALRVPIYAGLI
jgi:hypothetical protein